MQWRIREASGGSFHAEYGGYIQTGIIIFEMEGI